MKITNLSSSRLYLHDLRITRASQAEGRPGEDRYLGPGGFVYLPNTSEVLRSAYKGDLRTWAEKGVVELEDKDLLTANGTPGDTVDLEHGFGLPPVVYVLKKVGATWVDATGVVDIVHDGDFTTVSVTNVLAVSLTILTRLVL